jgi:hypothetical protein
MFFRRVTPKVQTFAERVDLLKQAGFVTQSQLGGRVKVSKHGISAIVGDEGDNHWTIEKAGPVIGGEMATLLNMGYQMFLETPEGKRYPATAEQLKSLHAFEVDVKATLGLTDLYNTSLGTTSRKHMYDRVTKRDSGHQPKPWERKRPGVVPPETKDAADY